MSLFEGLGESSGVDTSWTQEWPFFARRVWLPCQAWHLEAWPMRRRCLPQPWDLTGACVITRRLPCAHDMFIEENRSQVTSVPTDADSCCPITTRNDYLNKNSVFMF